MSDQDARCDELATKKDSGDEALRSTGSIRCMGNDSQNEPEELKKK